VIGLPCTFLCTALRVETFYFKRQFAGFLGGFFGKSALTSRGKALRGGSSPAMVPRQGSQPWCGCGEARQERLSMSQSLTQLLLDYLPIIVFIGVAGVIGLVLLVVAFVVAYKQPDPEKLSAYECGFNAFDDARMKFDVRFYLVAILFIIFDLEVSFLFPWAAAFGKLGLFGFWSMMLFLGVLTIGFIYEWKKGALEWD
jgi:NADH-quinone oxidoreductase subunit A